MNQFFEINVIIKLKNNNQLETCENYVRKKGYAEAVVQRYSVKKVFLGISQNSQENTCARVSF